MKADATNPAENARRFIRSRVTNCSIKIDRRERFVYGQSMDVRHSADDNVSRIAGAIGEPARTRMLLSLMDGRARTSTELAMLAEVTPSTASVHLGRLKDDRLVKVSVQGRHRYYSLDGPNVARVMEGLSILAGTPQKLFAPTTPSHLRNARTCYDHMAGTLAVKLHDHFIASKWIVRDRATNDYLIAELGEKALADMGIQVLPMRQLRRRLAYPCMDWSERRPHIAGALGAVLLETALVRKWIVRELDDRALRVSQFGRRQLLKRFRIEV